MMIKLYKFGPAWGLPDPSPFCLKVETYLRMAGLDYEAVAGSVLKAPKKKLPYLEDGGETVADSGFILDHLRRRYGDPLDARLTPAQHALALAVRRLLEEHLYWVALYSRWLEDDNWAQVRPLFFSGLPWPLRALVAERVRVQTRRALYAQGLGRHNRAEVYRLGADDLAALAALLGEHDYLLGEAPTSVDATLYGFLANLLVPPLESPLRDAARAHANLAAYTERMRARYYA